MSEEQKRATPPSDPWLERCRRADRQRQHDQAVNKGVPIVAEKENSNA